MALELTDTHCHIHSKDYPLDPETVIQDGQAAGVSRAIVVGTDVADSERAVAFAQAHPGIWSSIGIHPHEASRYLHDQGAQATFSHLASQKKVVAVGECGLDYFYHHSEPKDQQELLHFQLDLAKRHHLPVIFHVREAFDDFWPIFDQYQGIQGVVHSFTASSAVLEQVLERGLYIGLNGIMTFSKKPEQLAMAKKVPLDRFVLETDAPFLTPVPYRGTICQLKHVRDTAEFLAELREEDILDLTAATTESAIKLFRLDVKEQE